MGRRANGEGTLKKRSDGRWNALYYDPREVDPKKQRKCITKRTQAEAKNALHAALHEIEEWQKCPLQQKTVVKNDITVKQWITIWLQTYKLPILREGTYNTYSDYIDRNIIPFLGSKCLQAVTGLDIQQFYSHLLESKEIGGAQLSKATVLKIKNIISGAFKQAVTNKLLLFSPVDDAVAPTPDDPEIRILSKEEQERFSMALPFFNTGLLFSVNLSIGARIGELCALTKDDINRKEKYIDINKTTTYIKDKMTKKLCVKVGPPKTKYSKRRIPLLPSVEVLLDRQERLVEEMKTRAGEMWQENNLAFPTCTGTHHTLSGLRKAMSRIAKRAGIEKLTLHALRHTYVTTALNSGVAAQNVARIIGHKDGATTLKYYAHYINGEAISQLKNMEAQYITNYVITEEELNSLQTTEKSKIKENYISKKISAAIAKGKNFSPLKSVDIIMQACEGLLLIPLNQFSSSDKDLLLNTLANCIKTKKYLNLQYQHKKDVVGT